MIINIKNLFDYCSDDLITKNKTIFYIGDIIGNSIFIIAINNENKFIYSFSNEWLYLIKEFYYPNNTIVYNGLISNYYEIIENKKIDSSFENFNVISFITSFSKGTIHGYSGLFCILNEYVNNLNIYKEYKIIVYNDSQQGILDIINYLVKINIISKEKIIYLSSKVKYLFNTIKLFPNKWHMYPNDLKLDIIDKYFINPNYKNILNENKKICIIKSSLSDNKTSSGIIDNEIIEKFCKKNNLFFCEPSHMNEIDLINILYDCKIFIASWGTAFFKNYIYISYLCEKIIVLVIGKDFISQYNNYINEKKILYKYKNANIIYHIVDINLDINLDI
jgi:hypothetical protein